MKKNNNNIRKIAFSLASILLGIIILFIGFKVYITKKQNNLKSSEISNFSDVEAVSKETDFKEFEKELTENNINTVYAEFSSYEYANIMFYTLKNNDKDVFFVQNPNNDTFKKELLEAGINVKNKSKVFEVVNVIPFSASMTSLSSMLSTGLTILFSIISIVFIFLIIKRQGGFEDVTIGKFKKEDIDEKRDSGEPKSFDEVGGLHEVKEDLKTVVDFMKNQQAYLAAGASIPRGILLVGPPGTGKTLLARVIAKEADVNFLYMSGSDFVEMFVGRGAARVRSLFKEARKQAPCIIFIDEIDTLCGKRGIERGEHSEDRKTLTALLAEMDGFKTSENILVIGATNRIEDIDPAVLRPGRFTDIYNVPLPETLEERMEIIKIYMKNKKFAEDFDEKQFAKEMIGRSPAEIEAILNEATIISVKNGIGYINKKCIEEAFYKRIMQGHQKNNNETDPRDLEIVAYHEAGHTLLARLFNDEVTKVTIIPSTAGTGGATFIQPSERKLITKQMMENKVMGLYGGRVAELLLADDNQDLITQGASNDIEKATEVLKEMVESFGMTDDGLVNLRVLNRETSEDTAKRIKELSKELYDRTVEIIRENFDLLEAIANELLEKETIYADEIDRIVGDKIGAYTTP